MRFYFELAPNNVEFATKINEGVRPRVLDEDGGRKVFIVYTEDVPNEIVRVEDVHKYKPGTALTFVP